MPSARTFNRRLLNISSKDDRVTRTTKSLLQRLPAQRMEALAGNVEALDELCVGSLCSGSNVTSVLVADLLKVLKRGTLRDAFACEFIKSKQQFLEFVSEWLGEDTLIFGDINEMGNQRAIAVNRGNKPCLIPSTPLLTTCGFSCKNLSRLYHSNDRSQILDKMLEDGKGSSGNTCQGMLAYLARHQPPFHIWENVPSILEQKQRTNFNYLLKALRQCGYVCATDLVFSGHYHLPQDRYRAYGVCINIKKCGLKSNDASALAQRIVDTVIGMASEKTPSLKKSFLLKSNTHYLSKELTRLQRLRKLDMLREDSKKKKLKWHFDTTKVCRKHKLEYKSMSFLRHLKASAWLKALPLREQTAIMVHTTITPDLTALETSQGIKRMTRGYEDTVKTITPKGRWVLLPPLVPNARVLTGFEKMRLQGFPDSFLMDYLGAHRDKNFDVDRLFSELSGNAFSGPVIEASIIAILAHLQPAHLKACKSARKRPSTA